MLSKSGIVAGCRGFLRSTPFRFHVASRVSEWCFRVVSVPRRTSMACRSEERSPRAPARASRTRESRAKKAAPAVAAAKRPQRPLAKQGSSKALCFTPKPRCQPPSPEPPPLAAAKGHPEQPEQPLSTCEGRSGWRTHRPSLLKAFATIDGTSLRGLKRNGRFFPTL